MAIRAIIFDVGGVLNGHHNLAPLDPWCDRLKMSTDQIFHTVFGNEAAHQATLGQATVAEIWQIANEQFGLSEDDKQALMVDFWATMTWDDTLLDFIRTLKTTYKTGVLSDAWPDARVSNTRVTDDLFDVIVYSAEEKLKKPDPEIYRRTLTRLGVEPAEAIYVDDSPNKVAGAQQVGMHAILFTDTTTIQQQINNLLADQA
ncbi:MAG: HAD family phosphatase [Anaerolineae bacterium]|nr:HAD family phosphatase [Anaerolineae bacterium]